METSPHQKWVNLSYLVLAAIVGYVIFALGLKIAGAWDLEARVRQIDLIIRGASVGIGGILFLVLWRHDDANQFMNEVMVELSRVTWPTQKETTSATGVVIIMVLLSGMMLGLFDYCWTMLMKWIL
jgi:preprotein translocase SecE subunit